MIRTKGYAVHKAGMPLTPWSFERRPSYPEDVVLEELYSGICHSPHRT